MKLKVAVGMFLVVLGNPLKAQMRFEQSESRSKNPAISYEAVALFSGDSSKQLVSIHYRISQNYFIFVRNESTAPKAEYIARGELAVELLNDRKISAAREIRQLPISRTSLPKEGDHPPSIQGIISFSVPPGNYTVVFDLDDRESGRSFMEKTKKIKVPDSKQSGVQVSDVMLVQSPATATAPSVFVPTNRDASSLLGEGGGVVTEILRPVGMDTLVVHWKLHGMLDGSGARTQHFADSTYSSLNGLLSVMPQQEGISYDLKPAGESWKTIFIPLPLQKLEPGVFTLEIDYRCGLMKKQQQNQFHVSWPARPFSLLDQDLAVDALRHIAKESEIDVLLSGGATRRAEAFSRFWRERSKDTTTAYNEVMAEFYYRVDDALRRFSTARENDGYKTDRGRIYILYGPPQKSERSLQPNSAPTEIWTYDRLHRRFIFIDAGKNGNYVLSQSENL
ncbi:MAG: GWxTD domain-containing protein [Ignavibacteriales bacterium]|nr:GWxTD domain-containing protein [Ignavibacteriales bacterium]